MREIKFRAWDESIKAMDVHLGLITSNLYYEEVIQIKTLMQYTGLKDKNGREIYEGDIVENKYRHKVEFITGCFCVKDKFGSTTPIFECGDVFEVVGNIYENPELLGACSEK